MTKKSEPVFAPDEWKGPPSAPYAGAAPKNYEARILIRSTGQLYTVVGIFTTREQAKAIGTEWLSKSFIRQRDYKFKLGRTSKAPTNWLQHSADSYQGFSLAQLHAHGITQIDGKPIPAEVLGRAAYECDVRKHPTYHDGTPRCTWEQLYETSRLSWVRNPTSRDKEDKSEAQEKNK